MPGDTASRRSESRKGILRLDGPEARIAPGKGIANVLAASSPMATARSPGSVQWSAVELGPELPISVFTSTERWIPERIGAVAIYCSDGRWGESFDEFCHKHLQIPRYDRLALAGGPACFAPKNETAKVLCGAALDQLSFLVKVHELKRIVLITHYGCAAYTEQLQQKPDDCLPAQLDDLRTVREMLRGQFENVKVEIYLAMRRGAALSFHAPAS